MNDIQKSAVVFGLLLVTGAIIGSMLKDSKAAISEVKSSDDLKKCTAEVCGKTINILQDLKEALESDINFEKKEVVDGQQSDSTATA